MTKTHEVFRKGNDPGKDIKKYDAAVAEFVDRIPVGEIYEWKRRGQEEWRQCPGKPLLKGELLDRSLKVGDAFLGRREGGTAIFVLRAVEVLTPGVPCPDSEATEGVKKAWDAVQKATIAAEEKFNRKLDVVYMGIYACRRIDGSSTWSQHAFRNGLDFRIRRTEADAGSIDVEATTFVVYRTREVVAESLWQSSGHTFHAHLTGEPKRFGTPACA